MNYFTRFGLLCSLSLTSFLSPGQSTPDSTQVQNLRYIDLYRTNTPLTYIAPQGELGAPRRYVLSSDILVNYFPIATRKSRFALAITPSIMVRINRDEPSAPVRTPSFRLGARAFYRLTDNAVRFSYLEGQVMHHSNGQDGDTYRPNGTINTATGDFSTNYVQGEYHWGMEQQRYATNYALGLRWHAPFFGHTEGLKQQYGFTRLLGQAQYRFFRQSGSETASLRLTREWLRLHGHVSYAVNELPGYALINAGRRFNAEVTILYVPPFSRETGLFVTGGYYGEDPYNIYFQQHYGFVRVGIAVGYLRHDVDRR